MGSFLQVLSLLTLLFYIVSVSGRLNYTYHDLAAWPKVDPSCGGTKQSPINLNYFNFQSASTDCPAVNFMSFDDKPESMVIKNVGHTVVIRGKWSTQPALETNNDLVSGSYRFSRIHLHWAEGDDNGTEHTLNGRSSTLELHAVFLNNKYKDDSKALESDKGIVFLTRLFTITDGPGELDVINEALNQVKEIDSSAKLSASSLMNLGVKCKQTFVVYEGSRSTPPCTENVTWMFCTNLGTVSRCTVDRLRKLKMEDGETNNIRPIQNSANRPVYYLQCQKKKQQ